ncbi:hypothetical protein YC2023_105875 [Brassica napus]
MEREYLKMVYRLFPWKRLHSRHCISLVLPIFSCEEVSMCGCRWIAVSACLIGVTPWRFPSWSSYTSTIVQNKGRQCHMCESRRKILFAFATTYKPTSFHEKRLYLKLKAGFHSNLPLLL